MTNFYSLSIVLLFLSSCTHKIIVSEANLPPGLVKELNQTQNQVADFSKSQYGEWCKLDAKTFEKTDLLLKIAKPAVGDVEQALCSIKIIRQMGKQTLAILESKNGSKLQKIKKTIEYFETQTPLLVDTKLTQAEVLTYLVQFHAILQKALSFKSEALNPRLKFIIYNDLKSKKDEIAERTITHEVLTLQNIAYRAEPKDWEQFALYESPPNAKKISDEDLKIYAKINKYEEILNLEKLKKLSLENKSCLEKNQCHICNLQITNTTCARTDNLTAAKENKMILGVLADKPELFLSHLASRIEKLSALFTHFE